jgi:hypothetical protein
MPLLVPSHDKQGTPIGPALLLAVLRQEAVKKVRSTFFTFFFIRFFIL